MKNVFVKIDEWIGAHIKLDYTLHFIAGWIITNVLYMILLPYFGFEVDYHLVSALAFFGTMIIAVAKEIVIDSCLKKSSFSLSDVGATLFGSIVGIIFMEAFKAMNIFVDMYVRETIMNNWLN